MKRLDAKLGMALMATLLAVLSSCSVLNGTSNGNGDDVYGISTKKQTVTTPAQAQEMHAFIRSLIAEKYGKQVAEDTTILYGGSCNEKNAAELFANPDVDGGLIGGASLVADKFKAIIDAR